MFTYTFKHSLQNFTMPLPKKDNPLTKHIGVRVTPEMHSALKAIPDYQEKLRELIQQLINSQEKEKG
ncbi:hypothetical protein DSM106972_025600 [Dulcicalothrix desertica PCC 7102]|uniref:Uncharacterized protein n=2 Tax=Dulcicalothrix desertica TaxID=32056 RepID=A0A3S1CQG7_9CYAN|nr:hypothetical protein DSM106972_025600 [Dulcicalothrix desertica PCC 7102]